MRYGELGQNGATAEAPSSRLPAAGGGVKDIPYDYVATFKLTGEASKRVQDVITVSTEGAFVAVSVGYSFLPKALDITAVAQNPPAINGVPLGQESLLHELLCALPATSFAGTPPPATAVVRSYFQTRIIRDCGINFRYSVVDSGTGRELQNQAIHNIAGLGGADGERPFRPFARPALFMPRSTIRIEVEEVSEGPLYKDGTLFIVLHGYKRLGE